MLAEYIDGGLEPRDRAKVEEHLAECEECYEAFAETIKAEAMVATQPSVRAAGPRRGWIYGAIAVAAASVLWLSVGPQTLRRFMGTSDPRLEELAQAVGDRRTALPRLTGGFAWGPPPPVSRGSETGIRPTGSVTVAIGKIETELERDRNPSTLRNHAIAEMVLGRASSAVEALKEAAAIAPKDASIWSNLAAAYLMRSASGDHASDLPAGYDAASTALELDPRLAEALFNRALILEQMDLRNRAADDWNAYLQLDASSKWADEARAHLTAIGKRGAVAEPSGAAAARTRALDVELPAWAAAAAHSDEAAAQAALHAARSSAAASGDQFLSDVIKNIEAVGRRSDSARTQLGKGLLAFAAAETKARARDAAAAERGYLEAISLLQPLKSPVALAAIGRLAEIRDDDAARRSFLAAADGRRYPSLEAQVLWSLGMAAHASGQFAKAGNYYRDARAAYRAAGDDALTKTLDGQIASLSDELGLVDDAWKDRLSSFAGISDGRRTRQQQALFMTGAFWAKRSDWPHVALLCSRESIAIARELGDTIGEADALIQQALSFDAVGDHAGAIAAANQARGLIRPEMGTHFASLNAKLALTDAQLGVPNQAEAAARAGQAAKYYASIKEISRLPEALAIQANRLRADGKAEIARATLAQGLVEVAALQRQSPGAASIAYADSRRPLVDEFVDLSIAQGRTSEAFDALEEMRAGDHEQPLSLSAIQTLLSPDATMVVYGVQREAVTIFVVRHDGVRVARSSIKGYELNRLVSAFENRPSALLGAALKRLLIDPAFPGPIPSGPVAIVPDGVLHRLSFAALPGHAQAFFVQEHSTVYGLSASSVAERVGRADTAAVPKQLLAVGASAFDRTTFPLLAALPRSAEEAEMVAAMMPGARAVAGIAATREAVIETLARADGLHFSGHAVVDELRPERSMLVVTGSDQPGITAAQLAALNLTRVRLAVLAACETASGKISRTAGPLGIVRSMAGAGVHTIVASRTPLDDAVSIRLFRHFYEALLSTGDPVQALQQSQIAMIGDPDPAVSDPARWSGVMVLAGFEQTNESVSLREARRKR